MTTTSTPRSTSEAPAERAAALSELVASLALGERRLTPEELEAVCLAVAARGDLWEDLVVDSPERRWWIVLHETASFEVRLLSWEFEQSSGWHDHAGSSGGFVVTAGVLHERYRAEDQCSVGERSFSSGEHGCFGAEHVHDVSHEEGKPAVSVHAYSPPLTRLTMYELTRFGFVAHEVVPDDTRGA